MKAYIIILGIVVLSFDSCKSRRIPGTRAKADISSAQLEKATLLLKNMEGEGYLPSALTMDGCEQRAYPISALLAGEGIPSSALIVENTEQPLRYGAGVWGFHVATLVRVDDQVHLLDPFLGYVATK